MDSSIDEATPPGVKIARQLFWINLIPAIVAVVMFVYSFFIFLLSNIEGIVAPLLFIPGLAAQYVYYRQMSDAVFAQRPWGWKYSMIINGIFMAAYIASIIIAPTWFSALIIYPLYFLANSWAGLQHTFIPERNPLI